MKIDVFNTHIEVYPYSPGDLPAIEKMYTSIEHHTGAEVPCGYLVDNGKLYIPRGTPVSRLEYMLDTKANYILDNDPALNVRNYRAPLYDPRDELQEKSIQFLCGSEPQKSLNLATGKGKAEPYSNVIPTPDGYRRFGDLKIGDYVFSRKGTPTKILNIFEQGEVPIYKIRFEDDRVAHCTAEHLWTVKEFDGEYHTVITKDLYDEYTTNNTSHINAYIPTCEAVQYPSHEVNVKPWLYGFELGQKEIEDPWFYGPEAGCDESLHLADEYVYNTPEVRANVLQGLFDKSATYFRYGDTYTIVYTADSFALYSQVINMLRSFGHYGRSLHSSSGNYRLLIEFPNAAKYQKGMRYYERVGILDVVNLLLNHHYQTLAIKSIELSGTENARCIMVDNPEHLYLTTDYIVTHNTFCVAYATNKLRKRALIITPTEGLKVQWISTYQKMIGYREGQVFNIAGGAAIKAIMDDFADPADVYVANHSTLRNYLTTNNGWMFHQFMKKLGVGIKVYDEAHMEFGNILLLDAFSNTEQSWYLTATFGRSDKSELKCFKQAFSSVVTFGENESLAASRKHVIYHTVQVNTKIDPYHRAKLMAYPGFSVSKFGKYAFFEDKNDTTYHAIVKCLELLKDVEGKVLIFVPLIDAVDKVAERLRQEISGKKIGRYHSKMSKDEKEEALERDIIVSTMKSCGTGKDIPGLRAVINSEPFSSKVLAQQSIGRIRPYGDYLDTYFFDIVQIDILPCNWWWRGRYKKIQELAKKTLILQG